MRRRVVRHVQRTVDGDAVVEVHRVPHRSQCAVADALDLAFVLEHPARRLGDAAHLLLDGLLEHIATLVGVERDGVAPLLAVAARDVRDEPRLVLVEHDEHLFGQVDLGVVGEPTRRAAGRDLDRILHPIPHLGSHLAAELIGRRLHHERLERPHGPDREVAVLPVGRTRIEAELGQSLLHSEHVLAGDPLAERAVERDLDDRHRRLDGHHGWGIRRRRGVHRGGDRRVGRARRGGVRTVTSGSRPRRRSPHPGSKPPRRRASSGACGSRSGRRNGEQGCSRDDLAGDAPDYQRTIGWTRSSGTPEGRFWASSAARREFLDALELLAQLEHLAHDRDDHPGRAERRLAPCAREVVDARSA